MGMLIFFLQLGSSSSLWNYETYGCLRACSAVSLLSGLNYIRFLRRSKASSLAVGKTSLNLLGFLGGSYSNIVIARGQSIASISS